MTPKKIFFYTQVYFLDNALEHIKMLCKQDYEVHVMINLSPNQFNVTVLNLDIDLSKYNLMASFDEVKKDWKINYLETYLSKCASVNFALFPNTSIFSTLKTTKHIKRKIREINPDYIHLDEFSNRHLFIFPFLLRRRKKLILNVHDPKLHSGEDDKVRLWSRKLLFKFIPSFVVFSKHSKNLLIPQLATSKKTNVLKLMPYTTYRNFIASESKKTKQSYISFIGRISPYKGVEVFAEAIDIVLKYFPKQKFLIAGKTIPNYSPSFLKNKIENLKVVNKFLDTYEMADYIKQSKVLVCPYKDATQSGVIMTAYALDCPVIVNQTGGLPEYVVNKVTGLVCTSDSSEALADSLIKLLKNDYFKKNSSSEISDTIEEKYQNENIKVLEYLYP